MEQQSSILLLEHDRIATYNDAKFTESSNSELVNLSSGAIVPLSMLNVQTLKLSNRLSDEEMAIQVEMRMFEEGNLNSDEEYTISYIRHTITNDDDALVEAFALSHTKAQEYFQETLTKVAAIDRIVPTFVIYSTLYGNLAPANDLFIYWGDEEAIAVVYQNGHYIAHRTIETMASIAVETGLELSKLKQILQEKGLVEENYLPQELDKFILIQERIAKNIERIVQTINHKRSLFGLAGVDNCYLDFETKTILGLESFFKAYGLASVVVTPLTRDAIAPDELHRTLCAEYFATDKSSFNLSPYPRKPKWYTRESGKFLAVVGGTLLALLIGILTLLWMSFEEQSRNEELQAKLVLVQKETQQLATQLKKNNTLLLEQKEKNRKIQEDIALFYAAKETASLINDIHMQRQKFLNDTVAELGKYRLGALVLDQNGSKEINISVVSDYNKRYNIAKVMRGLFARGYQNVQTHRIDLDDNTTRYHSLIKVTR